MRQVQFCSQRFDMRDAGDARRDCGVRGQEKSLRQPGDAQAVRRRRGRDGDPRRQRRPDASGGDALTGPRVPQPRSWRQGARHRLTGQGQAPQPRPRAAQRRRLVVAGPADAGGAQPRLARRHGPVPGPGLRAAAPAQHAAVAVRRPQPGERAVSIEFASAATLNARGFLCPHMTGAAWLLLAATPHCRSTVLLPPEALLHCIKLHTQQGSLDTAKFRSSYATYVIALHPAACTICFWTWIMSSGVPLG